MPVEGIPAVLLRGDVFEVASGLTWSGTGVMSSSSAMSWIGRASALRMARGKPRSPCAPPTVVRRMWVGWGYVRY